MTNKTQQSHSDIAQDVEHEAHLEAEVSSDQVMQSHDTHKKYKIFGRYMDAADIFKFAGLVVFILAMVVVCIFLWPYVSEFFEPGGYQRVIDSVRSAGPGGVVILLVIQFIQIVVAFIPGEVVQIAAGLIYGLWIGALIIWAGCILSSAFIFLLVHKLGAPFVQSMVPEKYMNKFNAFEKRGRLNIIVFILFFIPGLPKDVFTYITPLTHMPMRNFLILTNIARIPGIVLSTFAAAGLVNGNIVGSIILFAVVAAIAIAALLSYERIMKYFEKKLNREDLDLNSVEGSSSDEESSNAAYSESLKGSYEKTHHVKPIEDNEISISN